MDCVEQQFESRDNNIASLEKRLEESGEVAVRLQSDLDAANEVIARLTVEAEKGMAQQKILLKQYQEAEMESRELQEFLQAEKMTLSETLKVREIITQEERQVVTFNDFNVVSHALLRAHRLARGPSRCPAALSRFRPCKQRTRRYNKSPSTFACNHVRAFFLADAAILL